MRKGGGGGRITSVAILIVFPEPREVRVRMGNEANENHLGTPQILQGGISIKMTVTVWFTKTSTVELS